MSTTRKHYTDTERSFFLKILKKYKHIIENKKSDSAILKDKDEAWREINEEYNSSLIISGKRSVKQLKKWWSNLKMDQRNALTAERQARMGTGGGPPIPVVNVDPEIENITPNLMTRAPTLFSSNISKDEIEKWQNAVLDNETLEEYLSETNDDGNDDSNVLNSMPGTSNMKQCLKSTAKVDVTDIYDIPKKKFKKGNKQGNREEKELKLERIHRIIQYEEKLADLKYQHEIQKQSIEIEHLNEKNSLEIQAATASVALAELLLREASSKYE